MIEVYKYGGNLLKDEDTRKKIYEILKDKIRQGVKIFMVVSALGRENNCFSTSNLSKNIELLSSKEKDRIVTFGEIYSSLIIKNELLRENVKVETVNYDEIGIMCDNNYQDGNIDGIDMSYLGELINRNDVVVVPGFIGQSLEGNIISMGRNTSDLTAIIIANYFDLKEVNIIKEVKGVYKKDPSIELREKIIDYISYNEMISLVNAGSKMFAKKSLEYAKENNVIINIRDLDSEKGTIVSNKESKENILFVTEEGEEIKVVFKDMNIFNVIFKEMVDEKIRLDDLVIIKNVVYLKGNKDKVKLIIDKYL